MVIKGEGLSAFDVYEVAVNGATVSLDPVGMEKVRRCSERVQEWGEAKHPIYGVNTGFGELIHIIVPPQFKSELQYNLLRSHSAGAGPLFPDEIVRAIMTARLNYLIKGHSGASAQSLELLREFLNRRIHPVIPQQGSLGASGDLAQLSHMALPLIGDGYLRVDGRIRKAAEVLEEEGLNPVEAGFKEALALVNGTSAMTGVAAIALVKASNLMRIAVLASADVVQCLEGSSRPFDPRGHRLKNHAGQIAIARALHTLISDSELVREHTELMQRIFQQSEHAHEVIDSAVFLQAAYSLRCIPQILGPGLEALNFCRKLVEEELNSCNDNPLIFEAPEDTFHGGNFHGQYVAMACDFLNIALTEIGVLAERQLNRLLDPHLNGNLPAFLAQGKPGLICGFEGAQYLATSIAAENLDLAAPASIKSIPSNGSNQDVVSMGLTSARKSLQLCENVGTILSVLVAACYQASQLLGQDRFSAPVKRLHRELSKSISTYRDTIPINELLSSVRDFLLDEPLWSRLDISMVLEEMVEED